MDHSDILSRLPYSKPFLFVDELIRVNENGVEGTYLLDPGLDFYRGHFKDDPVTPGVILIEIMAQIGLVCLGVFILKDDVRSQPLIALTSADVEFIKPVFPGERVTVISAKKYFRFGKLKCHVKMLDADGAEVCSGILSGMVTSQ